MKRCVISLKTRSETLERWLSADPSKVQVSLAPQLTSTDLSELINKHRHTPVLHELLILIASHKAATEELCSLILRLGSSSPDVAHAVATSSASSKKDLRVLQRKSEWPQVVQHATLALLSKDLPHAGERKISRILRNNSGDTGIALGIRFLIASSPKAPVSVLRGLMNDEADFIAIAAKKTFSKLMSGR